VKIQKSSAGNAPYVTGADPKPTEGQGSAMQRPFYSPPRLSGEGPCKLIFRSD
jgi:hypothetical protein